MFTCFYKVIFIPIYTAFVWLSWKSFKIFAYILISSVNMCFCVPAWVPFLEMYLHSFEQMKVLYHQMRISVVERWRFRKLKWRVKIEILKIGYYVGLAVTLVHWSWNSQRRRRKESYREKQGKHCLSGGMFTINGHIQR